MKCFLWHHIAITVLVRRFDRCCAPITEKTDDIQSNVRTSSQYVESEQLKRQLLTMAFVSLGTPLQFAWICTPYSIHNSEVFVDTRSCGSSGSRDFPFQTKKKSKPISQVLSVIWPIEIKWRWEGSLRLGGGAIVSSGPGGARAFLKPSNKEWIKSDEGTLAHMFYTPGHLSFSGP